MADGAGLGASDAGSGTVTALGGSSRGVLGVQAATANAKRTHGLRKLTKVRAYHAETNGECPRERAALLALQLVLDAP